MISTNSNLIEEKYDCISLLIKSISYSYSICQDINLPLYGKKITERITVYFQDGRIFEYMSAVQNMEELYGRFINSESVGKFWHKHFKDKIQYKRIK